MQMVGSHTCTCTFTLYLVCCSQGPHSYDTAHVGLGCLEQWARILNLDKYFQTQLHLTVIHVLLPDILRQTLYIIIL